MGREEPGDDDTDPAQGIAQVQLPVSDARRLLPIVHVTFLWRWHNDKARL